MSVKVATAHRDRARVFRSGGPGVRDPSTGVWTKPDDIVLYDGPVNVQAGGLIRANRRATGTPFSEADGYMNLPRRALGKLMTFEPGDSVTITYAAIKNGSVIDHYEADAEVTFVMPESRDVLLRYR